MEKQCEILTIYLLNENKGWEKKECCKLSDLQDEFCKRNINIHTTAFIGNNVCVANGVVVDAKAVISDFVELRENTYIGIESVIGYGTKVGCENKILSSCVIGINAIVENNAIVKDRTTICNNVTIGSAAIIGENSKISNRTKVGISCFIGNNVFIGENVTIGYNVRLENNCNIENNVLIKNSVLLKDSARVESFAKIEAGSVIFNNIRIPTFVIIQSDSIVKSYLHIPLEIFVYEKNVFIYSEKATRTIDEWLSLYDERNEYSSNLLIAKKYIDNYPVPIKTKYHVLDIIYDDLPKETHRWIREFENIRHYLFCDKDWMSCEEQCCWCGKFIYYLSKPDNERHLLVDFIKDNCNINILDSCYDIDRIIPDYYDISADFVCKQCANLVKHPEQRPEKMKGWLESV